MTVAWILATCLALGGVQQPTRDAPRPTAIAGGSISGTVYADDGKTPLKRAVVRVSAPQLPQRRTVRTDIVGRYRVDDLPAGRYVVNASKPRYLTLEFGQRRPFEQGRRVDLADGQALSRVDVLLPRAGAISGVVLDDESEPVGQMWVVAARYAFRNGQRRLATAALAVTNDAGEFRLSGLAPGDYYVIARERDVRISVFTDDPLGFPSTYYPGTAQMSDAQTIRVALGQEIVNIAVGLTASRTARLSGRLVDESGTPVTDVRVSVSDGSTPLFGGLIGGAAADADGRFSMSGLRPGLYELSARSDGGQSGTLRVEVRAADVTGLTLVIGPGTVATGRITSADGTPPPNVVDLRAVDIESGQGPPARVKPDGTFELSGLTGERLWRTPGLAAGWWLRAVMQGNVDVIDTPVVPGHGESLRDLTIVLDHAPTELKGEVHDAANAPVADYTVVIFSTEASRWGPQTRFVRADRPDHRGAFRISGLPPGAFLAAALEYIEDGEWQEPGFLDRLRRVATGITLAHGEKKNVQLTLTRVPER